MLSASTNSPRNVAISDDRSSVRSFSSTSASPSRLFRQARSHEAVGRQTTISTNAQAGRMGGLDRMLGRAMQYLTDSESSADRRPDDIWLLGVRHDGWRAEDPGVLVDWHFGLSPAVPALASTASDKRPSKRRFSKSSIHSLRSSSAGSSQAAKGPSVSAIPFPGKDGFARRGSADTASSQSVSRISSSDSARSSGTGRTPPSLISQIRIYSQQTQGWPPAFYLDFYSRIQLTYRSGFAPIQSSSAGSNSVAQAFSSMMSNLSASIGRDTRTSGWQNGNDGPTSDAGWGCMLRTGQSLLANALLTAHVGRGASFGRCSGKFTLTRKKIRF